jgi:hypothetical protein
MEIFKCGKLQYMYLLLTSLVALVENMPYSLYPDWIEISLREQLYLLSISLVLLDEKMHGIILFSMTKGKAACGLALIE